MLLYICIGFLAILLCRILLSIQIMIIYHQFKNHKWISLYIRIFNNNFNILKQQNKHILCDDFMDLIS
jgi:hypothetical protein